MKKFCFAALFLLPILSLASQVRDIKITGNERISESTIESYITIKKNTNFDQTDLDQSIKKLYDTGFFSDINFSEKGAILYVAVKENPIINQISFEGNSKLEDSDLNKEITMSIRSVFAESKVQADTKRIINAYHLKGRYNVKVEPKIIRLDNSRVNLVYEINEGKEARIQKIVFSGNKNFSDDKLERTILSKEEGWYRIFSSSDVYDPERIAIDQEFLKHFYMNEGYADFEVVSSAAELSPSKDSFILTFILNEGEFYNFGETTFDIKIPNISTSVLSDLVSFQTKEAFNISDVESSVDKITDYFGEHGYAFVDVDCELLKDREAKIVNIKFTINESYRIYINKINILNNTRTLDKVIRREMRIDEGDPYNSSKIYRSKQRIKNLGYFNSVDFENIRTDEEDKVDIDVQVEEKSTGSINFAGGYNTATGPMGLISLSETNFLGKGQDVGISFQKGKRNTDINFSFTEPYFLDKRLSAGFDIFHSSQGKANDSSFDSKATGAGLRLGYEITEHLSQVLKYSAKREKISNVPSTASRFIKEQIGSNSVSSIGHVLTYDKLDDYHEPTKGYILRLSQDLAGVGGQTHFFENRLSASTYYPVYKKSVILSLTGKAGHIEGWSGDKVRINDKFFMGPEEIRGFDVGGIGPRDKKTDDALGGKTFYSANLELTFPLGVATEYGLKGLVFADAGSLFGSDFKGTDKNDVYLDKKIRASTGFGINWKAAAIGDIRVYYSKALKKERYDDTRSLYIAFGTRF